MEVSGGSVPFAGCLAPESEKKSRRLILIGFPDDSQSSFLPGSSLAPKEVRLAYDGRCFSSTSESGIDLEGLVADLGDLDPEEEFTATAAKYRSFLENVLRESKIPFIIGGDHAVTVPAVEALRVLGRPVHILQIDAHPDLYPSFKGSTDSHACTAARVSEMDHVASITQLGIRCLTSAQAAFARKQDSRIRTITANRLNSGHLDPELFEPGDLVYVTVDLDGLDPAYAPGVSHPVPGGLSSRQVLDLFHVLDFKLVGMDVVEVNPAKDVNRQTAILAARILHEGMAFGLEH